MQSLPPGYRALVIGASGAIGAAFVAQLQADPACAAVVALHRHSQPALDYDDENSIAAAAAVLAEGSATAGPFHLIVIATGVLHREGPGDGFKPEKKLGDLHYAQMLQNFRTNAAGPALVIGHFSRLLAPQRALLAVLSAKVGSIGDNRLGGWYSYRASKAALNMFVKTAAIEVARSQPGAVLVALHPGTVSSALSKPFRGGEIGRAAADAAADMLGVLDGLTPADSGGFFAYSGERLPW
jgi:NAD(P)-dependent dehydrogenase (short-subunit alcohol dehydrogenase family)